MHLYCVLYLLRVEQRSVSSKPDLVDDGGLEVHEDGPGHVLAGPGLREEGVEAVVAAAGRLVGGHGAVRLDAWARGHECGDTDGG